MLLWTEIGTKMRSESSQGSLSGYDLMTGRHLQSKADKIHTENRENMTTRLHRLTVLSAGLLIYEILSEDEGLKAAGCCKVFPVVSEEGAQLPYVCLRMAEMTNAAVKGSRGPDTAKFEIACYASGYAEGVNLAEAVLAALDGLKAVYENAEGSTLAARSVSLTNAEETWSDGSYIQTLTFTINI